MPTAWATGNRLDRDEDDFRWRQERTEHQVEKNDEDDEEPPVGRNCRDRLSNLHWEFRIGQHPSERTDETYDQADDARKPCRVGKNRRQLPERGLPVENRRNDEGIDDGYRCRLGRREPAEQDATHDDERDEQGGSGLAEDAHELGQGRRLLLRIVAFACNYEYWNRHTGTDQDAGNDTGRKHGRDRLSAIHA